MFFCVTCDSCSLIKKKKIEGRGRGNGEEDDKVGNRTLANEVEVQVVNQLSY